MADPCGAITRSGGECKKPPLKGKTRCKLHGGKSSGPKDASGNTNAATHGIYQQHLTDSEREMYNALELGKVDHEILLARIRLARTLAAENLAEGKPELDEVTENDGGGENVARESRKKKVRDYNAHVDRLQARIGKLELQRLQMQLIEKQIKGDGDGDTAHEVTGFDVIPYDDEG